MIVNIPVVRGTYPVTAVGSPLKVAVIVSVVAVPVAVSVWAELQAAEEMALVARALAPLAIVWVIVALADGKVIVVLSVPATVMELETVRVFPLAMAAVPAESRTFPLPFAATVLSVTTFEEFVQNLNPVPAAPGQMCLYDVTEVGAWVVIAVVPALGAVPWVI